MQVHKAYNFSLVNFHKVNTHTHVASTQLKK